jgi:hypothetical protein
VPDAERDCPGVQLREIAVEQVFDNRLLPRGEHLLGNFPARLERPPRQRDLATRPRQLELQLTAMREHDEAAFGAGNLDRRIEHERQHFIQHTPRAERAQPFEQQRHLAELAGGRNRAALDRRGIGGRGEHDLGVARLSEAQAVARHEHVVGDALAVDEGAEARLLVVQGADAVLHRDFGVEARDIGAREPEIGFRAAADREERLVDRDNPAAERIGDHQARSGRVGHRPAL